MKIADLFASIGFKVDSKALDKFTSSLNDTKKELLIFSSVAAISFAVLDRFVDSSVRGAVALQNFSLQTGNLSNELQKFQIAGQLSDISLGADQITSSIQTLQRELTAIKLGQGNVFPFQILGISVREKDVFSVLDEIREKIRGLTPDVATNLLQRLGLSPNFINVLSLTKDEFDKLGSSIFRTKEQRDKLILLGTAITNLKLNLNLLKDTFAVIISPVILVFLRLITSLTQSLLKFNGIIKIFVASLGVLLMAVKPLIAMLLILSFIIEDIMTFFQGGDSLTGRFIESFKEFQTEAIQSLKIIKEFILSMKNDISEFFSPFTKFIDKIQSLSKGSRVNFLKSLGIIPEDIQNEIQLKNKNNDLVNSRQTNNLSLQNNFTFNTMESDERLAQRVARLVDETRSTTFFQLNNGNVA